MSTTIEFKEARRHVMPFGLWKDQTIDATATSDEGLLYLAWLMQTLPNDKTLPHNEAKQALLANLRVYMADKTIIKEWRAARRKSKSHGLGAD